jgi:class 3 adenylate cyclase
MAARIHLLGQILIDSGDSVIEERDLPGRKGRLALAYLIVERHRPIPVEELAGVLWPREAPEGWKDKLEPLMTRLQGLLDGTKFSTPAVIRLAHGDYELRLPAIWIDSEVAVGKLAEARAALERNETEPAQHAAKIAAEITDRPFLTGEEGPWIELQRERFSKIRTDALEILAAAKERAEGGARPLRVLKTFMFTDIVESTKLVELLGDDAWSDLVRWHDQTLRRTFESHTGEEIDRAGDGFFVAFPDQQSALACAVEIQRSLIDHRRSQGFAPQLRIGLHSAEVNTEEGLYQGAGVNIAARIAALAEGGQIVASRETVEHLEESRITDVRMVELKGIARAIEVVTLPWQPER